METNTTQIKTTHNILISEKEDDIQNCDNNKSAYYFAEPARKICTLENTLGTLLVVTVSTFAGLFFATTLTDVRSYSDTINTSDLYTCAKIASSVSAVSVVVGTYIWNCYYPAK